MAKTIKKKKVIEITETEKQQVNILLEGLKNYATNFDANTFAKDLMMINIPQKQLSNDWFVNLVDLFRMMKYPSFTLTELMQNEIARSSLRDIAASLIKQKVADFAVQTTDQKDENRPVENQAEEIPEVKPLNKLFQ